MKKEKVGVWISVFFSVSFTIALKLFAYHMLGKRSVFTPAVGSKLITSGQVQF